MSFLLHGEARLFHLENPNENEFLHKYTHTNNDSIMRHSEDMDYIPTLYIKLCAHNQSSYAAWYCCWAPRANKSVYLAVSQQATSVFLS